MKRQLACVLAACIGLQLPLGAFNAYGAQLPESAGQMEALEESKIPGLESDSRDEETQTEETEKETIPTASSSESHRQEDEEDGGTAGKAGKRAQRRCYGGNTDPAACNVCCGF